MEVALVFCPNCGTKNDDTATPCSKCGFKLSGASAPKFRGTMMLNSEQSVAEMVEEHRRKLAEVGPVLDPAAGSTPGSPTPAATTSPVTTPSTAVPSAAPKSVLQPPRAGLPKRRMGTMLGVAPQVGGVRPPAEAAQTPTPPPSDVSGPRADQDAGNSPPLDALGGTVAFTAVPGRPHGAPGTPVAPAVAASPVRSLPGSEPLGSGRTEAVAAAVPAHSPLAPGRTEAFTAVPAGSANPLAAGRTEAFAAASEPAPRGRTEALEATPTGIEAPPAPAQPEAPDSYRPAGVPRLRLRPLDVFLVVITCGLYGLVLWAKQQRKPS